MQYQYVASAHKWSSVGASVRCALTRAGAGNLAVAKGNRLEVYAFHAPGELSLMGEWAMNGIISTVDVVRRAEGDALLVTSEKFQFSVLVWDTVGGRLETESMGGFARTTGRAAMEGRVVAVDPRGRLALVNAYQGIVHLLPMLSTDNTWRQAMKGSEKPYRADVGADGLMVPEYVQSGGNKGKQAARAERSTDVFCVQARYIQELKVLDMRFLTGNDEPEFAVLYEDANMQRQVRVYRVDAARGLTVTPHWAGTSVAASASTLVPLSEGGVLVASDAALEVVNERGRVAAVAKRASAVTAWVWVDEDGDGTGPAGGRLLVADDGGELSLAVVDYAAGRLTVERLGAIPVATALAYLGEGCLYVASHSGNQVLVRLHTEPLPRPTTSDESRACNEARALLARPLGGPPPADASSFVEQVATYQSLAPLVDLAVVGMDDGGRHGSVVTCSGMATTPSLRVVRSGIGIDQLFGADAAGLMGVWALRVGSLAIAVAALVDRTVLVQWTADADPVDASAVHLGGWLLDEPTLAADAHNGWAVQVTPRAVTLIAVDGWVERSRWIPADGASISAASVCEGRVALAVGALVVCLRIEDSQLRVVAQRCLDATVACIDTHSEGFVGVGLWGTDEAGILALPDLRSVAHGATGGLARSVLVKTLGGVKYLFVGLGDGRLCQFVVANKELRDARSVTLGTGPVSLVPFSNDDGGHCVFVAAGDHSAVLWGSPQQKLMFATVDVSGIQRVAPITLPGGTALCVVGAGELWVGRPEPAQKLHVRSYPLPPWAAPYRIAHCRELDVFGLATTHHLFDAAIAADSGAWKRLSRVQGEDESTRVSMNPPVEAGRFSIVNGRTMEPLASLLLPPFEMPESLCVADLVGRERLPLDSAAQQKNDPHLPTGPLFVLGTSVVLPGDDDARRGRIMLLGWDGSQLRVVGSQQVSGAVAAVAGFGDGMLVAAVGSRLLLLGWQRRSHPVQSQEDRVSDTVVYMEDADFELVVLCAQPTQIRALSLAVSGDLVLVGDLMSSASLFRYTQESAQPVGVHHRLVPVARDYAGVWTTAVATIPPGDESAMSVPVLAEYEMAGVDANYSAFQDPANERFLMADAYGNLVRLARGSDVGEANTADEGDVDRHLFVEGRLHLGDVVNVVRPGSLVMDIPDPEFPGVFRPQLICGTVHGAISAVIAVQDGKVGRILDRLQTNIAHLVPTPGLWDHGGWRRYQSDQRVSRAFGFIDGDLVERFLDLPKDTQRRVFEGNGWDGSEQRLKSDYWNSYSRIESEGAVAVLSQFAVSDIGRREEVGLDYVVRLVECLVRLH